MIKKNLLDSMTIKIRNKNFLISCKNSEIEIVEKIGKKINKMINKLDPSRDNSLENILLILLIQQMSNTGEVKDNTSEKDVLIEDDETEQQEAENGEEDALEKLKMAIEELAQ